MQLKEAGEPELYEIDRFDRGVGWIAYPEERMQRASHAVAVPGAPLILQSQLGQLIGRDPARQGALA